MTDSCLVNTGVLCAIGSGPRQLSASFRAGLSGYVQSYVASASAERITMAALAEADLDPLAPSLETLTMPDRERRMLRLAGMALQDAADGLNQPCPLFLALPGNEPAQTRRIGPHFVERLGTQAQVRLDAGASQCFELGRAGGLFALQAGLAALASGRNDVLVGGVDTYLDLRLLATLLLERRLLGPADVKDGFVPGEGAAFLWLARKPRGNRTTIVRAIGTAEDLGHRYSDRPALGEGLSAALDDALAKYGPLPTVRTCFAGLNGEAFGAREWGVANMRHHSLFDPKLAFEHPADSFGDVGAAMGTLLIALADETLRTGQRAEPMLVWASSDHAPCACAFLASPG